MQRMLHVGLVCVLGALSGATSVASADTLDRSRVSDLIQTTAREIGQPFPGVQIQVLDPADHVRSDAEDGEASLDFPSLFRHIGRNITVPLGLAQSVTIGRHAAFAFFNREMATSLHILADGSTLCTVFPLPAPIRLNELAAMLSGADESQAIPQFDFSAADFYRFLLDHEVAHCDEDPRRIRARGLGPYDVYLAESRADAFAVLMYVKRTGDESLPRFMVSARHKGMANRGDVEHQTAAVIEPALALASRLHVNGSLGGMSLRELMSTARALTRQHALSRADFDAETRLSPTR